MARHHSRLLQLVVAGLLLGPVTDATATTYDDDPISGVPGTGYFGGSSTTYEYYGGYTDLVLNDIDYSESGGGSGGDSSDATTAVDEDKAALCNAISDLVTPDCDLRNPPQLTVNGCGGGLFAFAVPDYLMVNGAPNLRLGPIFEKACNKHDTCYGTYLMGKAACDVQLARDMVQLAQDSLSSFQWSIWRYPIRAQATLYSSALQTAPILSIATGLYGDAQRMGACRAYSIDAVAAGCLD